MELAFFLGPLLAIAALVYLFWPVAFEKTSAADVEDTIISARDRQELLDKKATLLAAIKDMEFDFRLGKINEEDYAELVEDYKQQAADVLGRLEHEGDELEALIAAARERIRDVERSRATESSDPTTVECPSCGIENPSQAHFCMSCGSALAQS